MTSLVAATLHPVPRPSARVARVAELLDVDDSQVRKLVKDGALEAHIVGVRGIRVYLDSVSDYQQRKAKPVSTLSGAAAQARSSAQAQRRPASTAAFRAAMASLARKGIAVRSPQ